MKKLCIAAFFAAPMMLLCLLSNAQQKQMPAAVNAAQSATKPVAANSPIKKEVAATMNNAAVTQSNTVADIAASSKDHTTLVTALKSANLVDALKGKGPFTVFAPTNDAFAKIPPKALEDLLKPENKDALTKILTSHVIAGNFKSKDIIEAIKTNNGKVEFATLSGEKLYFTLEGSTVKVTNASGSTAIVSVADIIADNGVVHVLDNVLVGK
jgi:uncharacterized surface protein with fasciclin (FAS1) repeats